MNCYDRDVKIDHDNKQRLDCQVKNLKLSTDLLNSQNKTKMKGESSSQYIGVCYRKDTKKWRAGISTPDGKINLGSFDTEMEAVKARDKKAKELNKLGNNFTINLKD